MPKAQTVPPAYPLPNSRTASVTAAATVARSARRGQSADLA